jgi:surface protein
LCQVLFYDILVFGGENKRVTINFTKHSGYEFSIDWGDGNIVERNDPDLRSRSIYHEYKDSKDYIIRISGDIKKLGFNFDTATMITEVIDLGNCNWESLNDIFYACSNLIKFKGGETSHVTNMKGMFCNATSLESVDLSSFDTRNVLDMSFMFHNTCSLKHLDLSSFDTSKLIEASCIFSEMRALESINLSSIDTKNIKDMSFLFEKCKSLKFLDLSGFNFDNCDIDNIFNEGPLQVMVSGSAKLKYFKDNEKVITKPINNQRNNWLKAIS